MQDWAFANRQNHFFHSAICATRFYLRTLARVLYLNTIAKLSVLLDSLHKASMCGYQLEA